MFGPDSLANAITQEVEETSKGSAHQHEQTSEKNGMLRHDLGIREKVDLRSTKHILIAREGVINIRTKFRESHDFVASF